MAQASQHVWLVYCKYKLLNINVVIHPRPHSLSFMFIKGPLSMNDVCIFTFPLFVYQTHVHWSSILIIYQARQEHRAVLYTKQLIHFIFALPSSTNVNNRYTIFREKEKKYTSPCSEIRSGIIRLVIVMDFRF